MQRPTIFGAFILSLSAKIGKFLDVFLGFWIRYYDRPRTETMAYIG